MGSTKNETEEKARAFEEKPDAVRILSLAFPMDSMTIRASSPINKEELAVLPKFLRAFFARRLIQPRGLERAKWPLNVWARLSVLSFIGCLNLLVLREKLEWHSITSLAVLPKKEAKPLKINEPFLDARRIL